MKEGTLEVFKITKKIEAELPTPPSCWLQPHARHNETHQRSSEERNPLYAQVDWYQQRMEVFAQHQGDVGGSVYFCSEAWGHSREWPPCSLAVFSFRVTHKFAI